MKFDGRVCHVEFGNDTSEKDRVQEVLKRLSDTSIEVLKNLTVDAVCHQITLKAMDFYIIDLCILYFVMILNCFIIYYII